MRIRAIFYPTTFRSNNKEKIHKNAEIYELINFAEVIGKLEEIEEPTFKSCLLLCKSSVRCEFFNKCVDKLLRKSGGSDGQGSRL